MSYDAFGLCVCGILLRFFVWERGEGVGRVGRWEAGGGGGGGGRRKTGLAVLVSDCRAWELQIRLAISAHSVIVY